MQPGSIVNFRERLWVVLPNDNPEVYHLRPVIGLAEDEEVILHRRLTDLLGGTLPTERPAAGELPLPSAEGVADAVAVRLFTQAARLMLREGSAPLRALGRLSIRPRAYQFVPLLMALRLDPVRMLIADDVGVGKTIEALLIARELWERGEISRLAVLCPPYLCDQWEHELREKFSFHEAVTIRASTASRLERETPPLRTIYEHYPVQVISIDWVKGDRNRPAFLVNPPELIIVDEAHGAALADSQNQQQRHALLRILAEDRNRHLILLTATPHSGVESAFRSLLGMLDPRFESLADEADQISEAGLKKLARHFVQRTRRDVAQDWEQSPLFPERKSEERQYTLSPAYRDLFDATYAFCAEIVRSGEQLAQHRRRVRYWAALALLRCVMSSPAAAHAALQARLERTTGERAGTGAEDAGIEEVFNRFVFESDSDRTEDEQPLRPIEEAEATLDEAERRKLRALGRQAEKLAGLAQDQKLAGLLRIVRELLADGFQPIVWCRYVATAEYVAAALRDHLPADAQAICITGRQADEERRARLDEIDAARPRVLVATDCLSEGVNLQTLFNAVVHYDLPWNPNRLEQREGRVDRYGQPSPAVRVVRYYGADNPVDGVVLDVLLRKAQEIYRALGTHVPVPEESESVTQAVLEALFLRGGYRPQPQQLALDILPAEVGQFHARLERDAERENRLRTHLAQRTLKPAEVQRELEAVDAVLGDPQAVRAFVQDAAQRLGLPMTRGKAGAGGRAPTGEVWVVRTEQAALSALPEVVQAALPRPKDNLWRISFDSPTPEGAAYVGRNHPFVQALAHALFNAALRGDAGVPVARAGALATRAVDQLTILLLLRVRYLVYLVKGRAPRFAEEVRVAGYAQSPAGELRWLAQDEAQRLLDQARPDANLSPEEKRARVQAALADYPKLAPALRAQLGARADELTDAHRRIRQAVRASASAVRVEPQWPPDLLGVLVLTPASP